MTARRNPAIPAVESQLFRSTRTQKRDPSALMGKFRKIVTAGRSDRRAVGKVFRDMDVYRFPVLKLYPLLGFRSPSGRQEAG